MKVISLVAVTILLDRSIPAHAQTAVGCFDEANPPSCEVAPDHVVDDALLPHAQDVCALLNYEYLLEIPQNLTLHGDALSFIDQEDALCADVRQVYHLCYWCTPDVPDDYCLFQTCKPPEEIDPSIDLEATCDEMNELFDWGQRPSTIDLCYRAEQAKHLCPVFCDLAQGKIAYLGAQRTPQKRALVWMSRTGAILSFFGACYIVGDVLSQPQHRTTVYHQLLLAMACFDMITATAWSLATAPLPKEEAFYIEGAHGTEESCRAQAFFVQLGFTSVFYNLSLSLYYVLVIVYSWREHSLRKIRLLLHGCPVLLGVGLALGGLPFYDWIEYSCHLVPPPDEPIWKVLVFAALPIGISIVTITCAMIRVYWSVRSKSQASRKWSLAFGNTNRLEQRVFWQALLYTLSFYVTWPIVLSVYITSFDVKLDAYGFTLVVAFVAPLQGFNNFLVYVRPKLMRHCQRHAKKPPNGPSLGQPSTTAPSQTEATGGSCDSFRPSEDPSVRIASVH
jgi:hypothetical protein